MKKTLLLSVVASTMIFAGGDIAPVEPAVVTPAPAPAPVVSGWKFSGQAVVAYQTDDAGAGNLFDQTNSIANAGLQLTATNDNLIGGIGFGAQLNGLGTLGLEEDVVSGVFQTAGTELNAAYFSQLYLTYGIDNTSFKVGRQELPKALSPFAFSEDWSVFKNTYNAALVVNTDLADTVLVGAWVRDANENALGYDMNNFNNVNPIKGDDGIWMLTAQNKSIADLTLTGSFYYANDFANILWADAQYNAGFANIGLQGGAVWLDATGATDTKAFGAQVSGKLDMFNLSAAYAHVNNSAAGVFNVGGSTSALYTETALNQVLGGLNNNMNKFVVSAGADVLGGNLTGVYAYEDQGANEFSEVDVVYSTTIAEGLSASVAYVYSDVVPGDVNLVRVVARYNF